jgi:hypothetical protein
MVIIKKIRTKKTIVPLLLCIILTSCSVPMEARKSAEFVSTKIVQLQKNSEQFSKSRLALGQARKRNMNRLENNAIETERNNGVELGLWNLGNLGTKSKDRRILLYEYIHETTENAYNQHLETVKRRNDQEKFTSDMKSVINFKSKKLAETAESLSALAKQPDLEEQLEFLIAFGQDVWESVEKLEKDAESRVKKVEKEVEGENKKE